jgi:hypothetical protein
LEELKAKMNIQKQVQSYSDIIINCNKQDPLQFTPVDSTRRTTYKLPPWVYFKEDFIYHDFRGKFENASELANLVKGSDKFSEETALHDGITQEMWQAWIRKSWIVPAGQLKE